MNIKAVILFGLGLFGTCLASRAIATPEDCTVLYNAIMQSYNSGAATYTLPAGTYTLANPQDPSSQYFLHLKNLHRTSANPFTIDFGGATLVIPDSSFSFLLLTNSQYVTVTHATIQYQVPPFTQGTITGISGKTYTVQLDAGYPDFDDAMHFPVNGEIDGFVFDPATGHLKAKSSPIGSSANWTRIGAAGAGTYSFTWWSATNAQVNDRIVIRGTGTFLVYLHYCGNITLSNMTVNGSASYCFFDAGASAQNSYLNVAVVTPSAPPSIPSGYTPAPVSGTAVKAPLISSCADGIHSMLAVVGPHVSGCNLSGMLDDGIAVHGTYSLIAAYDGDRTLTVTDGVLKQLSLDGAVDSYAPAPGDWVYFYDASGNQLGASPFSSWSSLSGYTAPTSPTPPSGFSWSGHTYYQVILQSKPSFTPVIGQLIASPGTTGSGYLIENCTIGYHRSRGIVAKADQGTIRNCTINGSSLGGIVMEPETTEADYSHDVQIIGNLIENCGYEGATPPPAVAIRGFNATPSGTTPSQADITFANNTVSNQNGINLSASQVDTLEVLDNQFHAPDASGTSGPLFSFANTLDATLRGNWITNPGVYLNATAPVQTSGSNTAPIGFDGALLLGNYVGYTNPNTVSSIGASGVAGKAVGFQVGATSYSLADVLLTLNLGTSTADTPIVQLWSANAAHTAPGTLLETLSNPSFTFDNAVHVFDFTSTAKTALAANAYYYLVVTHGAGSSFGWCGGSPSVTPGSPSTLATPTNMVYGYSGAPSTWSGSSSAFNWFQIDVTP